MSYDFSTFNRRRSEIKEWLIREYQNIRTGRATPAILDQVTVEFYGTRTPLKHVTSIGIEDPRTLRLTPWDKSQIKSIEIGLMAANLGLSVVVDGEGLRVIFPELTGERREQFIKLVKEKLETARVSLRQERERVLTDIKSSGLTDDEQYQTRNELQKLIDASHDELQSLAVKKEAELRT